MTAINALSLIPCSVLEFKLRTTSTSDKVQLTNPGGSDLVADGTINLTAGTGFGPGLYDLITYTGNKTGPGFTLGTVPIGYTVNLIDNTVDKKIQVDIYRTLSANFTGTPTTGNNPLTVDFTSTTTGDPITWTWDFGDGGTSNDQNPSHYYTDFGTYTVSLTVTSVDGQTSVHTVVGYITLRPKISPMPIIFFRGRK